MKSSIFFSIFFYRDYWKDWIKSNSMSKNASLWLQFFCSSIFLTPTINCIYFRISFCDKRCTTKYFHLAGIRNVKLTSKRQAQLYLFYYNKRALIFSTLLLPLFLDSVWKLWNLPFNRMNHFKKKKGGNLITKKLPHIQKTWKSLNKIEFARLETNWVS